MRVSNRAASRWAGAYRIRRTVQLDASVAPARVFRCKNPHLSAAPQLHQIQPQSLNADPLYLFHCGMRWHQQADNGAGWDLIHALKSTDSMARMIAGSLLSKTEDMRVLARDVRRAAKQANRAAAEYVRMPIRLNEVPEMNTPYGLEIIESCVSCKLRKDKWFCGFSSDTL